MCLQIRHNKVVCDALASPEMEPDLCQCMVLHQGTARDTQTQLNLLSKILPYHTHCKRSAACKAPSDQPQNEVHNQRDTLIPEEQNSRFKLRITKWFRRLPKASLLLTVDILSSHISEARVSSTTRKETLAALQDPTVLPQQGHQLTGSTALSLTSETESTSLAMTPAPSFKQDGLNEVKQLEKEHISLCKQRLMQSCETHVTHIY